MSTRIGLVGRTAIWLSGVVLFGISISIIGGTIESALTGSHPELKWMLLPVSIAISAGSTPLALRRLSTSPSYFGTYGPVTGVMSGSTYWK